MRRVTIALLIGIVLVVLFLAIGFLYLSLGKPRYEKQEVSNPVTEDNFVVEDAHIAYLLNEIGAYQLHNPPASSDKPKISVIVDEEKFYAEVDKGNITVVKSDRSDVDLKIMTSSSEVKNALNSGNIKDYIRNSVASGKTNLELSAGYQTLFFKGYLSIYQELTGKSFTGSVVRIFGQG